MDVLQSFDPFFSHGLYLITMKPYREEREKKWGCLSWKKWLCEPNHWEILYLDCFSLENSAKSKRISIIVCIADINVFFLTSQLATSFNFYNTSNSFQDIITTCLSVTKSALLGFFLSAPEAEISFLMNHSVQALWKYPLADGFYLQQTWVYSQLVLLLFFFSFFPF